MTEAMLKRTVESYLELLYNQGKLYYERLNAGSILALQGRAKRRIRLCREGTADFIVIQALNDDATHFGGCCVIFLELKAPKGKQSEAQREFQRRVEAQGCEYMLIKTIDELMEVLA